MNIPNFCVGVILVVLGTTLLFFTILGRQQESLVRVVVVNKWIGRSAELPTVIGSTVIPPGETKTWNLSVFGYPAEGGKNKFRVIRVSEKYYDSVLVGQILE